MGVFSPSLLNNFPRVLMLAAGTGYTPMVKLINYCLQHNKSVHLVFFNKTQWDMIHREHLHNLSSSTDKYVRYHPIDT